MLGDRAPAISVLQSFATGDSPFKWRALDLAIRIMDQEMAIAWLRELGGNPAHARLLIVATGALGDPAAVPWLIEKMKDPILARVAGESFSMITGVDLSDDKLDASRPESFAAGPTDEPGDENIATDVDENLPWPGPGRVGARWRKSRDALRRGLVT
jgi:uncharacterized protein (TIGR02270 family)